LQTDVSVKNKRGGPVELSEEEEGGEEEGHGERKNNGNSLFFHFLEA
jgi:hypothetical protein